MKVGIVEKYVALSRLVMLCGCKLKRLRSLGCKPTHFTSKTKDHRDLLVKAAYLKYAIGADGTDVWQDQSFAEEDMIVLFILNLSPVFRNLMHVHITK